MAGKSAQQKRLELWVVLGALGIIILSVLTTLWVTGVFNPAEEEGAVYQNVTYTDAVVKCETESRKRFADLRNLALDDLSSRTERGGRRYRIFLNAQRPGSDGQGFQVSCTVNAQNGKIDEFTLYEQTASGNRAVRDGSLFGWP